MKYIYDICTWASQVLLVVKNLPATAGDIRDTGSIPGSGRSPRGWHDTLFDHSITFLSKLEQRLEPVCGGPSATNTTNPSIGPGVCIQQIGTIYIWSSHDNWGSVARRVSHWPLGNLCVNVRTPLWKTGRRKMASSCSVKGEFGDGPIL